MDPAAPEWASAPEETLALQQTPWASQPSEYAQNAWKDRPYGLTSAVKVAAAHNGEALFFRLSWQDETKDDGIRDTTQFADGAAVLLPVRDDAPLQAMGSPEQPVNAWYWRADLEAPIAVTATGLGTTVRSKSGSLSAAGSYEAGSWRVVISRPFAAGGNGFAVLRPGQAGKVGFAVWQGSNQERAGIKATTLDWQPLEIQE
jgi:DMSO reductase family type II enzyme heme b subunit